MAAGFQLSGLREMRQIIKKRRAKGKQAKQQQLHGAARTINTNDKSGRDKSVQTPWGSSFTSHARPPAGW